MDNATKHSYSKEVLYHFKCGECGTWWTQEEEVIKKDIFNKPIDNFIFFCPSCGEGLRTKEILQND